MSRLTILLALPVLALGSPRPARAEPAPLTPIRLQGVGNGITLLPDPYFRWTPAKKEPRAGVMGTVAGPTREFENIELYVGADRRVLTAPVSAGYEAYRIKHEVEKGENQGADVKPELVVVRIKNPFRELVYATGLKQVGRTTVFVRGSTEKKNEAGLAKIVASIASTAKGVGDDIDGWLPPEVKSTWTHTPSGELMIVDDGTVDAAKIARIVKIVADAFSLAKRVVGSSSVATFPPVVRITGKHDLFEHLSGRRDLSGAQAYHLDIAAELLVSPKGDDLDAPGIAAEAAKLAVHYLVGVADADPIRTGLSRMAAAAATPEAVAGSLLASGAELALARARKKEAKTWYRLLMMGTLSGFLGEDADTRGADAELAVNYLVAGTAIGKTSITGWVAGVKKWGHCDAGAEGGVAPIDLQKGDNEYWAFWTPRADPPKKPVKPGGK